MTASLMTLSTTRRRITIEWLAGRAGNGIGGVIADGRLLSGEFWFR